MKYKIVEKAKKHGKPYFKPQYKPWFLPFYIAWETSYTGYDISKVTYPKKEEALAPIETDKRYISSARKPYSKIHNL